MQIDCQNNKQALQTRCNLERLPFAGAGLWGWGASVQQRERKALEDPVKNGTCLTTIRHL